MRRKVITVIAGRAATSFVLIGLAGGGHLRAQATAPASQAATDSVLVRFGNGDAAITQEEFNSYFYNGRPVPFDSQKDTLMRELIERKLFFLYLADHPDLLPDSKVDEAINNFRKQNNLNSQAELEAFLKRAGFTPEIFRMRWRMQLGRVEFLKKGAPRTDSDAKLKAEFDAHPEDYNGTQLTGRHILISVPPYATPEQKAALKAKAEAIRQELVDGKKTWAEAVQESDYPDRLDGGQLGYFMRHRPIEQEALTAAAFAREVNKIGDLVETTLGYHIVEVTSRTPGKQSFEESKTDVRAWLSGMELREAMKEAREKHPPVGVRPPQHPPAPASAPAVAQSTGSPIHKSATKPKP